MLKRVKYVMEKAGPVVVALISLAIIIILRRSITELATGDDSIVDLVNLYVSVFDWAAIQTGFLFGVYGYVMGKSDGFVAEIKHTKAMKQFTGYMLRATWVGFTLTLLSLPLIVLHKSVNLNDPIHYYMVSAWASIFVWSFLSFIRVAYNFGVLVRVSDRKRIPG